MRIVSDTDESFSFETLRPLGYAAYGGPTSARSTPSRGASQATD